MVKWHYAVQKKHEDNYKVSGVLIENVGHETDGLWDICAEILLFATK